MLRWLLIATVGIIPQLTYGQPQYRFQHFDTSNGLASDLSTGIVQDSLGFLWIDYNGGKTRYDGYNFKIYSRDPEDPTKSPTLPESNGMILDHTGNLWVIPMNPAEYFELAKYEPGLDKFVLYKADFDPTATAQRVRFERDDKAIWIATSKGLSTFNLDANKINEVQNYSINISDSSSRLLSNYVLDILVGDSVILLTTRKGLWQFSKNRKAFSRPKCNPRDSAWLYNTTFYNIFKDKNAHSKDVWLIDDHAFSRVNKDLTSVQRLILPGGRSGVGVMGFDRDKEGVFWIGTWRSGVCRYDPADSSIAFIQNVPGDPTSLISDRTIDVKIDRDQNIWVATFLGISKLQRQDIVFYNTERKGTGRSGLSAVYQSGEKDYIVISQNDGEHHMMIAQVLPDKLDSLSFQPAIPAFGGAQVNGFWKGRRNFWITVWGVGVLSVPVDPETGMILPGPITTLSHDPQNSNTISSNLTTSPWEDGSGNLWIGSANGLNKVVPTIPYGANGSVVRYHHIEGDSTSIIDDHVLAFYPENDSAFWLSTLKGVEFFSNNRFEHFFGNHRQPGAIHKSKDGILSIGTGGGLYEGTKTNGRYTFKKSSLLKNNDIVAIHEDMLGRLWINTKQGIVFYDRKEQVAIEFNKKDGFLHRRRPHPGLRPNVTSSGIMVISDSDGLTLFDPTSLRINRGETKPLFVKLLINNRPIGARVVKGNSNQSFPEKDIHVLDTLVLDHRHNNFSIEFSSMDFTSPDKNLYRHKLEGYDGYWIETDANSRTATYTNLDAGTYVFKVKASNYHGIWNDNEKHLTVVILPPPWLTWWAYLLYGLFFVAIALYWRSYEIKRIKLKQRAAHLTEMDRLKTRFFANISHEFRTPITLILGPLRDLYSKATGEDQRSLLAIMIRNGERLLRLINQLLDLSKIEAGKMHLRLTKVELVALLRDIASAYESLAKDKNLQYAFYSELHELPLYVDQEKIEKVVHNLLSNAFKFTSRGQVIMALRVNEKKWAQITVTDTGTGIAEDEQDKIFDRFYQVDSSQTRAHEGSGLGMALARELVELHHGSISVDSIPGKGTTFTVLLPRSTNTFPEEETTDPRYQVEHVRANEIMHLPHFPITDIDQNGGPVISSPEKPLVLVVEDNADMRTYIQRTLQEQYHIVAAADGKEGIAKATEVIPDLIISDVMMPEIDGYKLCEFIKTTEATSHIPVILLTAKADRDSKLVGLKTRADDYLTKPFDADELNLIIRNRIDERKKLRERFGREITLEPRQIAITSLDEKFVKKVMDIIEAHIDDEHFSITNLSDQVGYSHMQLYRKIKGLTGQTPNHFLRTIRLKRAAALLRHKSDNVAQIAYSVGFSSQSYFIKCFKEEFGVTPGEYMQQP